MKILLTGAAGFLGRAMVPVLAKGHQLRLADLHPFDSEHETITGNVASLASARAMVTGMDAVVLGHMASRQAGAYETPELPFDGNVKGTANLFFAAVEEGIKRVVLISSTGAVSGNDDHLFRSRDLPLRGTDMYSLTKALQEEVAEHYHRVHGLEVAILRPSWVVDADNLSTKYGTQVPEFSSGLIDRRDVCEAARLSCELPDLTYEVFYISGPQEACATMDVAYTIRRLGWAPRYRFETMPRTGAHREPVPSTTPGGPRQERADAHDSTKTP
jgi:nucleoside-diphosphate-sugar epimerase